MRELCCRNLLGLTLIWIYDRDYDDDHGDSGEAARELGLSRRGLRLP